MPETELILSLSDCELSYDLLSYPQGAQNDPNVRATLVILVAPPPHIELPACDLYFHFTDDGQGPLSLEFSCWQDDWELLPLVAPLVVLLGRHWLTNPDIEQIAPFLSAYGIRPTGE